MDDFSGHCIKDSGAPGAKCVCDFDKLMADIRDFHGGLAARRRKATCLGGLHALIVKYELTVLAMSRILCYVLHSICHAAHSLTL